MARLENWQTNLSSLINSKRELPFNFPTFNCLLWAFEAIEAVTGNDLGIDYRGNFTTPLSAGRLMRKIDKVETSQALLEKYLGELQPISFARTGDIVFASTSEEDLELPADTELFGPVPGVCYGTISYFVGEFGLIEFETLKLGQALWVS
jgi:hypothetical protein